MTLNLLAIQAILLALSIFTGVSILSDAQEIVPNETEEDSIENSLGIMKKLRATREGLESLQQVLHDIDEDLRHQQTASPISKRSEWSACPVGVSNPGFLCFTNKAVQRRHRTKFLQTDISPGKRSTVTVYPSLDKIREILATQFKSKINGYIGNSLSDINRKRKGLEILKKILNEMDADLLTQQKRTCKFDLGGHCATESAAAAADQWMFLQSPYSPGRRRRDTSLFLRKLVDGKSEQ